MEIEDNSTIEKITQKFHDLLIEEKFKEAEEFLLSQVKEHPDNDQLHYELGFYYYEQEDEEKAEYYLLKSIE